MVAFLSNCADKPVKESSTGKSADASPFQLIVLGTMQDGGSPHAGCTKKCCKKFFHQPDASRQVVSLGLVDRVHKKTILMEATPDISTQMKRLKDFADSNHETPDAIFLTHAHIGHYSGLMYLGREAMNARYVPVYVMPRMKNFLEKNGPWSQLTDLKNITLIELGEENRRVSVGSYMITAFGVPHRDEFSETAGFLIEGPTKKALFIPDIDKWEKWSLNILDEIRKVDYVFLDGTFYSGGEINNRNIKEIPHPFVIESMERMKQLSTEQKNKIYFIHLNHTNPLLNDSSDASQVILRNGFHVAKFGQIFGL